jgi:hypothetical protein
MTGEAVDSESIYEIGVDTDADAVTDIAFRVRFSPVVNQSQTASVQLATGHGAAASVDAGEIIIQDAPVTFGTEPRVAVSGELRFSPGSAVTRSSPTRSAPGTIFSEPATISLPTRTCSPSCWRSRAAR